MEETFHQQFYRVEPEDTMADLSGLCQLPNEGVETYLAQFKKARFKCKVSLPEREYVRLALNGLGFELKKKFYETEFRDLIELSAKATRYERILKQEQDYMAASKGTYYRDPNYAVATMEPKYEVEVAVAKLINKKPYFLETGRLEKTDLAASTGKSNRVYTFDITRAEAIFDQLMVDKLVKLHPGHKFPSPEEMKGREYCKYHNSWSHTTNNCIIFRDDIQDKIEREEFRFEPKDKKAMGVDANPFPSGLSTNMVSFNMRGMPRSSPRHKICLGEPSRQAWSPVREDPSSK
ncbi:uncharacterized protein LOC131317013 [Rhododendron vialii]|uniref:uncharacterized protein LOC131317013 n=1 Tax=Rhododendron vialii TaxID=182163 RepID=UPI00265EE7F4|nr:uncharacterized protein LOC131317013 [Rhododendron vialii]